MKLSDLNQPKSYHAAKALREHYDIDVRSAKREELLYKVQRTLKEMRMKYANPSTSESYTKMVFLEQALLGGDEYIVENDQVEKSEVVLSGQSLVDGIQDMLESASDLLVKDLSAVVDGITSEFGIAQGDAFNAAASATLYTLQRQLMQTKTDLVNAVSQLTGKEERFNVPPEEEGAVEQPPEEQNAAPELPSPDQAGNEQPEVEPSIGREMR